MATIDSSAITYQLKRVYGDLITDLFARHVMTYNMFAKSSRKASYKPGGEGFYFSVRQGDIESQGGRGEGHKLPEPLAGDGTQGFIKPRLIYGVLRLSGLAIEAGKGNLMSFVEAQGDAIMSTYKALTVDLNRQCWSDGLGKLAELSTAATPTSDSSTWTATCDNDLGVRYLRKGMIVDFFTSGGAVDVDKVAIRIKSVNPNTKKVQFEPLVNSQTSGTLAYVDNHPRFSSYTPDTGAIPSGSIMARYGARDSTSSDSGTNSIVEMEGLLAAYDDGTLRSYYEGITIASDPEFKANILGNSNVNRELTVDLMLSAMDMTIARSSETIGMIRLGLGQRRKYFNLLAPDVRYGPGQFLGGYEKLEFAQNARVTMIVDPYTPPNQMFFEPMDAIKRYELTPIGWGGIDGLKFHWRQDYDEATAFLRTYTNLGVENRPGLTLLDDLVEPSTGAPW